LRTNLTVLKGKLKSLSLIPRLIAIQTMIELS